VGGEGDQVETAAVAPPPVAPAPVPSVPPTLPEQPAPPAIVHASSSRARAASVSEDSPGSPDSGASSESLAGDQIELKFMPHPTEMQGDPLMRRLKDAVRYIKTPDHASGTYVWGGLRDSS